MGLQDDLRNQLKRLEEIQNNLLNNARPKNIQQIAPVKEITSSKLSAVDSILADITSSIDDFVENNQKKSISQDNNSTMPPFIQNHLHDKARYSQNIVNTQDLNNAKDLANTADPDGNIIDKNDLAQERSVKKGRFEEQAKPTRKLLEMKRIRGLGKKVKENVFGQDKTIDSIEAIARASAVNLDVEETSTQPVGSFLFIGPSGVGKTEVAKQLAKILEVPFFKLDMGEYGEKQSVARLLGAAPGLVGYDQGGQLTGPVIKEPVCILCLDEIEKAHRDIDNILLSLLDEGVVTDSRGIKVSYEEVIIIITCNLGAKVEYTDDMSFEQVKMMIFEEGWHKEDDFAENVSEDEQRAIFKKRYYMKSVRDTIKPEIVNRFDKVISFNSLELDVYKKVTEKFCKGLIASLQKEHQKECEFEEKALNFIVENSYDRARGGRPAKKFIKEVIIGYGLANYMISEEYEKKMDHITKFSISINDTKQLVFKDQNNNLLYTIENTHELLEQLENEKVKKSKKKVNLENSIKEDMKISEPIETPVIDINEVETPVLGNKVNKKTKLPQVASSLVTDSNKPLKRKPKP